MALIVGSPKMLSSILKNANKIFVNSASFNRFFRNGVSPIPFMGIENAHGLHLSSITFVEDPPKQPLSPFLKFMSRKRLDLLKLQPGLKQSEIAKQAGVDWNALALEHKKPYEENYKAELAEFKALKERWWNSLTNEQKAEFHDLKKEVKRVRGERVVKKRLRLLGKPKKPLSALNYVVSRIDKSSVKSGQTVLSRAMEEWRSMSDADKEPFVKLASKDKVRYEGEMVIWEQKMKKEGHVDVIREKSKAPVAAVRKVKEVKAVATNRKTNLAKQSTTSMTGKTKPGLIKPPIRS